MAPNDVVATCRLLETDCALKHVCDTHSMILYSQRYAGLRAVADVV